MVFWTFILIVAFFPTPFIIWNYFKEYIVKEIRRGEFIGLTFVSIIPIFNHATALWTLLEYTDYSDRFKQEMSHLNEAFKCRECNITSRRYQFNGGSNNACPQCGYSRYGSYSQNKEKKYPFAPKLTALNFIKWKHEKNKMDRIQKDLNNVERIDNELQAYEQLQLKKLYELEAKANEIKAEMAQRGEI